MYIYIYNIYIYIAKQLLLVVFACLLELSNSCFSISSSSLARERERERERYYQNNTDMMLMLFNENDAVRVLCGAGAVRDRGVVLSCVVLERRQDALGGASRLLLGPSLALTHCLSHPQGPQLEDQLVG
jgi:hypothetical protein